VGELSGQIVEASCTTEPWEHILMAALCAAAECCVTARKEEKESTAVKLKAVSTNVGLPNNRRIDITFCK